MASRQELIEAFKSMLPHGEGIPAAGLTKSAHVIITDGEGGEVMVTAEWFLDAVDAVLDSIEQLAQGDGTFQ